MKLIRKAVLALALVMAMAVVPTVSMYSEPQIQAQAAFTTTATGYKKASDVVYVKSGTYIAHWGARGEDCTFLSQYAESFYTGSYVYETLSKSSGSTAESSVPSSALYKSLQTLMTSKHSYQTSYNATRDLFCYTDCVSGNYSKISSFYSGRTLNGAWDGGSTWNREHTWPNSKGDKAGNGENDIMMLRPASVSENSSRGNKAYGTGSSYYDPNGEGANVRGDCARIVLYQYVRWGCTNTGSNYNPTGIFGTKGVMESINVLLQWIQEDPVDTWEMGRNDAVQAITGTRNVFVDYPEYAWLLFGKSVPQNVSTPSQMGANGGGSSSGGNSSSSSSSTGDVDVGCQHEYGDWIVLKEPSETEAGKRAKICGLCGDTVREEIPALCQHVYGDWVVLKQPTETENGKRVKVCELCGNSVREDIPKLGGESNCSSSISGMVTAVLLSALGFVLMKKEEN